MMIDWVFLERWCEINKQSVTHLCIKTFPLILVILIEMQVYLYGGHVTSWKDENGEELLHLSSKVLQINTILFKIVSNYIRDA